MGRTTAAHARMRGVARSKAAEGCGGQAPPQTSVDEEAATPGPLNVYTLCAVRAPRRPLAAVCPALARRLLVRVLVPACACACVCLAAAPRTGHALPAPLGSH